VLLSESAELQSTLRTFGLETQLIQECEPVTISSPSALRDALTVLGENRKMVRIFNVSCLGFEWPTFSACRLIEYLKTLQMPRSIIFVFAIFHGQ
jgi:hypothetical protein